VVEELVAKINGDIITNRDLAADVPAIEEEIRRRGISGAEADEVRGAILRSRIDEILLRQKGKDLDIKIEQEVNREIANYMRNVNVADPDAFQKLVVEQTGKPYEDFRAQIQDNLLVQAVIREEVMRKIQIPAAEIRAYYDTHKDEFIRQERVFLRQIVVSTVGKTGDELAALEAKAKDLSNRGRRGETFATMAQNNSDDPSKDQGGFLEPFTRATLNEQLVPLVWDKEAGYVTDPVRVANGWLILKVEAHHREGLAEFEEVEGEVQNRLFTTRTDPALRAYMTKLRQEAFLQIKDGYMDTGAAPGKDTRWRDPAQLQAETVTRAEVLANPSMKKLLGLFPVPGTEKTGASSSR
jgi:parvulin-like peptidyl-prolyl isomerase